MSAIQIRPARPSDALAIRTVHAAAFGQPAEAGLVDALVIGGFAEVSLVALDRDQVVGHVLLSRLTTPPLNLALAPLAVLPSHQRQGIGSALAREAILRARAQGSTAIFVLGDPAYYGRFGFARDAALGFDCAYAGDHFMALMLTSTLASPAPLVYPPPFQALGD